MAKNRARFSNQRGLWKLSRSNKAFAFKNISMKKCFVKITIKKRIWTFNWWILFVFHWYICPRPSRNSEINLPVIVYNWKKKVQWDWNVWSFEGRAGCFHSTGPSLYRFPDILLKSYSYTMLFPSCSICWFMHLLLYFSPVFYQPPTLICGLHGDKSVFSANLCLEPGTGLEQRTRQLSINLINIHYSYRIWSIIHQFGNFR